MKSSCRCSTVKKRPPYTCESSSSHNNDKPIFISCCPSFLTSLHMFRPDFYESCPIPSSSLSLSSHSLSLSFTHTLSPFVYFFPSLGLSVSSVSLSISPPLWPRLPVSIVVFSTMCLFTRSFRIVYIVHSLTHGYSTRGFLDSWILQLPDKFAKTLCPRVVVVQVF